MDDEIFFAVVGLTGDVIAELQVPPSTTVAQIKLSIYETEPTAAPALQKLLLGGRELPDTEVAQHLSLPDDGTYDGEITVLHLVIHVELDQLLNSPPETCVETVTSLDAMGDAAEPCVTGLFQDIDPANVVDGLRTLRRNLKTAGDLNNFKVALRPNVLEVLMCDRHEVRDRRWMREVLPWLGPTLVPHLVSWLAHLDRPLAPHLRQCLDVLKAAGLPERVVLAARIALSDTGGVSSARIDELASLWRSLGRNVASCRSGTELARLKALRHRAYEALLDLGENAADCKVRYKIKRILGR
eukprot:TRINITY_DN18442_c0_g1_i1.p1 TRINITY_DN18442_c0_g1~~TRINITY_DN18442_c0_g1_i1.p1  ORF type:complete len:299 (-),score=38.28 TRINITY_DN18442_c0_g1_i1:257-1153(-)